MIANEILKKDIITHDLVLLAKLFKDGVDKTLLSSEDVQHLHKATPYYNKDGHMAKGIVYFEANVKQQALKGYRDLPTIDSLIRINDKFKGVLEGSDYYIDL